MATEAKILRLRDLRSARSAQEADPANPIVFKIPAFQRALVWPEGKQKRLIDSIMRGFPIGALLLVESEAKRPVTLVSGEQVAATEYSIIDGLQRTNAIALHLAAPLALAGTEAIIGKEFNELRRVVEELFPDTIDEDELTEGVLHWMHETKRLDVSEGWDFDSALSMISEKTGLELDHLSRSELKRPMNALLKHIGSRVDISNIDVPVLVYRGPRADLADIFEQINTAGTVLSKYEVFAAAWIDTKVRVPTDGIRKAITRRYEALESEGYDVDIAHADDEDSFTLFDYLHGLSQHLGETFPSLFSEKMARENKLSAAFPLATLLLGNALDQMSTLDTRFPLAGGVISAGPFKSALLEAARIVDRILERNLAFQFKSDTTTIAHGELQIVSMIAAVAANVFDHTKGFTRRHKPRPEKQLLKRLETALPQHYLYDIVRQQWRGSLYSYAMERVWNGGTPSDAYFRPVGAETFRNAMQTAHEEQLAAVSRGRRSITAADKVVLRFLYSPKISVQEQKTHAFDVEHLIPVSRIQQMTKDSEPWAIGALGNLAVLPAGPNRRKREETVAEYISRKQAAPDEVTRDFLKRLMFSDPSSVTIPKVDGKDAMSKVNYVTFVENNWSQMVDSLVASLQLK